MSTPRPSPEVDAYLDRLPEPQRRALAHLRSLIRDEVPDAEERMSYGIPSYRLDGMLVGFGAATNHCTLHLMGTATLERLAARLEGFGLGKGSVRFTPDRPLPDALVREIVAERAAENRARRSRDAT